MTDTSRAARPALIETRSIDWVPEEERTGKVWHQAPLWFLGNFQYFSVAVGFIGPSLGLSLGATILASVLGICIGTVFMAFHASQGPTMGLPQLLQSRAQFGYRGVVVPLFAALFTYLAFTIVTIVLLSEGMNSVFGMNPFLVALVGTALAAVLAIFGHDSVHKAFRILLYISVPLVAIVTVGIFTGAAAGDAAPVSAPSGFTWAAFLAQVAACAAYNIIYAPYVSDYSRYLPSKTPAWKVITSVFFGAAGSAIWLIALGAWLAIRLGSTDGLAGLQLAGNNVFPRLGSITALASAAALLGSAGMSLYGAMLVVLTAIDSFRPVKPTQTHRVVAVVALAAACFVVSQVIPSDAVGVVSLGLTLMLYLLVPWTAVNLVDFFFVRRGHYAIAQLFSPRGIYGAWSWRGLLAYGVGLLAEIPFMVLGELQGPVAAALGGIDLAWLVGLVVAGALYVVLARSIDVAGEQRTAAERGELVTTSAL